MLLGTAFGGAARADVGGTVSTPSGLAAAATAGGVRLLWDWNPEPYIFGYVIERRTGAGSWGYLSSTWRTDFTDTTAARGTSYSYRVTAESVIRATSSASGTATVTAGTDVTAPGAGLITGVAGSGGDRRVTFKWNAPASDPSLTGVGVERRDGAGAWTWYGTFAPDEDHWTDDWRIVNGTRYSYRFYAMDATGIVLQSAQISNVLAGVDTTAPATPTGLTASAGDSEAGLTWTRNSDADVEGYELRGRRCAAASWVDWGSTEGARRFLARWLVNDTSYCFQVRAVNASGNASGWTASTTVTPDRVTIQLGLNGGSDFYESWITPLYDDVRTPDTRIELDATQDPAGSTPLARVDRLTDEDVRPLILAGYGGTYPTRVQAATFCGNAAATYGPGGTAGLSDDLAVRYIEFGNESSYSYMPTGMYTRPEIYADRLHACVDAATAANPFVGVLAIADDPTNVGWVDAIYTEMPDADALLSGWTTHPYGPPSADPRSFWQYSIDSAVAGTSGSTLPLIATELGIATTRLGTTLTDNFGWSTSMTWSDGANALEDVLGVFKSDYPRLSQVYWYLLHDGATDNGVNNDREDFFGLLQVDVATAKGDLFDLFTDVVDAGGWY